MIATTKQNTITRVIGTSPYPILGSSPTRKAIIMSPVAPGGGGGVLTAVSFAIPGATLWPVPAGVTSVVNAYCWGASGNAGAAGGGLGGGGGGGGAFASSGPLTVTPGSFLNAIVGTHGSAGVTQLLTFPGGVQLATAGNGASGVADVGGAGGVATVGTALENGGAGDSATGLAGPGAGAGGGAGSFAFGSNGAASVGGAGGGAATLLGFGAGGKGGNGGIIGASGQNGASPGGGGGGAGGGGASAGSGTDGLLVIFYNTPVVSGVVSLSHRQDVVAGQGILNYLPGTTFPTIITDHDIGTFIGEEWWIVSSVANVVVQITEYLHEC